MTSRQYIKKFNADKAEIEQKLEQLKARMTFTHDHESWMAMRQAYNVLLTKRAEAQYKINNARAGKNPWGGEIDLVTIPKNR